MIVLSVVALVTVAAVMRDAQSDPKFVSFEERYERAAAHPVEQVLEDRGVRALVIEARRVEPNPAGNAVGDSGWFLEIVVEAEGVRNDERLSISPREMLGMSAPADLATTTDSTVRTRIIRDLVPVVGGASLDLLVIAWSAQAGEEKGPGRHSAAQCAVPLNTLGTCEMTKREGRILTRFSLSPASLGVPALTSGAPVMPPPPGG